MRVLKGTSVRPMLITNDFFSWRFAMSVNGDAPQARRAHNRSNREPRSRDSCDIMEMNSVQNAKEPIERTFALDGF